MSKFIKLHRYIERGEEGTTASTWINKDHIVSLEPGGVHQGTRVRLSTGERMRVEELPEEIIEACCGGW